MYCIKTTPTFDKDIKRLDRQVAKRVIEKMEYLAAYSVALRIPVKYLPKRLEGLQKYRVGNWRVYFWADHKKEEITLYGIEHRRKAYKRFRK